MLARLATWCRLLRAAQWQPPRSLSSPSSMLWLSTREPLPPRPTVKEEDFTEVFLKGSGPGGQKINKTSSAVQLKHLPTGLVVKSQDTRSRTQNRHIARRILAEKLEAIEKGDMSRVGKKVERAKEKKARASKKTKRKYRRLAEEKEGVPSGSGTNNEHETESKSTQVSADPLKPKALKRTEESAP